MLTTRLSRLTLATTTAVLLSLAIAAPAHADDSDGDTAPSAICWADTDSETGTVQCFADETELEDAVLAQTGGVLVREGDSGRSAGALAVYVIAELFQNASYGGTVTAVTSSSSTVCGSGSVSGNLSGASNNSTSSFKSYFGCVTTIYDLAGQSGASYGPFITASSVGAMNDRASSYTVT